MAYFISWGVNILDNFHHCTEPSGGREKGTVDPGTPLSAFLACRSTGDLEWVALLGAGMLVGHQRLVTGESELVPSDTVRGMEF